jgi:DNA-binding CsgD family transcriptional regulator
MATTSSSIDVLSGCSRGVILVDADGAIRDLNFTAREILSLTRDLRIESGRLSAAAEFGLADLIHRASGKSGRGFVLAIDASNGSTRRWPLFLLGIRIAADGASIRPPEAAVAVLISDPELEIRPNQDLLRVLFGLTRRESAIATILMNGRGLKSAGDELHITVNTVRGHLKSVMSKTGTTRQSELVRLLFGSLAMACPPNLMLGLESHNRSAEITVLRRVEKDRLTGIPTASLNGVG